MCRFHLGILMTLTRFPNHTLKSRKQIPVFRGITEPLISKVKHTEYHGADGFGDIQHDAEPNMGLIKETISPIAMYEIVKKNPGEIDLILLAPLTNVAMAIRLFDDFAGMVKGVYIMGGNHSGVGNVTPCAEFNFYFDPEGASIVLESFKSPITLLTWETCLELEIQTQWRLNELGKIPNKLFEFLLRAETKHLQMKEVWNVADAYLIAVYLNPSIIEKLREHNAEIELHGSLSRGILVLDHLKTKCPNVVIVEKINQTSLQDMLLKVAKELV